MGDTAYKSAMGVAARDVEARKGIGNDRVKKEWTLEMGQEFQYYTAMHFKSKNQMSEFFC